MNASPPVPVTPLKQHRGQHGGLIALGLLVATTTVVWITHTRNKPRADETIVVRPQPAVTATLPREPERVHAIELGPTITTAVVGDRQLRRALSATAPVTLDDIRTSHVRAPVAGWLVKTRATSLGRTARAGETLGVIYSPEVYLATQDLLGQLRTFTSQELLDKERMRLLRWGMRPEQVAQIERSNQPSSALPLIARVTGFVVAEQAGARGFVDPSLGEVFTITDPAYASVWLEVPVADAELAKVGMPARVTIARHARPISATIGYIARRAIEGQKTVRVDLRTAGLRTPPDVDAKVEVALDTARGLAIPAAAVLRDGDRTLVFVVNGQVAEPRAVKLGASGDGVVLVTAGLAAGDTVAFRR